MRQTYRLINNDINSVNTFKASIAKALNLAALAGLLAYSHFRLAFPFYSLKIVASGCQSVVIELTVARLLRILT
jgi:hypothetical protein